MWWVMLQKGTLRLRNPTVGIKHAWPLLRRVMLLLLYRTRQTCSAGRLFLLYRTVNKCCGLEINNISAHYINIFEKGSPQQRQSDSFSTCKTCITFDRPMENCLPIIIMSGKHYKIKSWPDISESYVYHKNVSCK